MFRSETNVGHRLIVWSWSGRVLTDEDFAQATVAMRAFSDELRLTPPGPVIHVNIVGSECSPPTYAQRKALANLRRGHGNALYHFFYVTRSPIARGVMTAISWMQGKPPFFRLQSVGSMDSVFAWASKEAPDCLETLKILVKRIEQTGMQPEAARHAHA
jgi:hypothetical protein